MVKKSETLSSSSIVLKYIKEKIANNEWSKGDKIYTEPQFMDILGVSRAAVRKAINQLVDSNILIKIQGNGTFISENISTSLFNPLISHFLFDEYDALSVLEFRKLIEPSCVSLFIDLLSDEKIDQLKSCIRSMEESELTNNEEFYKADFNFHNIIVKGTQNALASKIMDLLHESLINYQYKSNKAIGPKTGLKEHKQIFYAIESKDKELASLLMKRHIERSEIDMKNYINNNTVLRRLQMIKNNEPIKLKNAKAWRTYLGGSLLRDFLGLSNTKDDHFPEEWIMSLVSARNAGREDIVNEGLSIIDDNKNISLKDLISKDPSYYLGEAFSKKYNDTTGVLIKLIDSSERLSVQVHPDKNTAKKLFNSNYGKTECWHILGGREINGEKPCIYLGFKENITQEYWKDLFNKQDIKEMLNCMHKINVKIGETYLINGGIPHAIGAGCFLVEIQEPTDYTIRVERITDSGFKIADSMCHQGLGFKNMFKCFHYNGLSLDKTLNKYLISKKTINKTTSCKYESYIDYSETKMFSLYGLTIHNDTYTLKLNNVFSGIFILEGSATMKCGNSEYNIKKADEFFLPKNCKSLTFTTNDNLKLLHFFGPKV